MSDTWTYIWRYTWTFCDSHFGQDCARKIRSFKSLPEGWNYGVGVGATDVTVNNALEVTSLFAVSGADNIEVFPAVDGGILVSGYSGNDTLEVLCRLDGKMDIVHETSDDPDDDWHENNLCMVRIEEYLGELNWLQKKSSVCCTHTTLVSRKDASTVWLSIPHPIKESRFSRPNAPLQPAIMNVNTLKNSMIVSLGIRMYFGASNPDSYPQIAISLTSHPHQEMTATEISEG